MAGQIRLTDLPRDILGLIISPELIGRVGCTIAYMGCREMQTIVNPAYILRGSQLCDGIAADGCLDLMKWALEQPNPFPYCKTAATAAAAAGHVHILEYLLVKSLPVDKDQMSIEAAGNGHFSVFKWMRGHGCTYWCDKAYYVAAAGGHLDVLQYIDQARFSPSRLTMGQYAAKNGRINVLEWLCRFHIEGYSYITQLAIENDQPEVLDWWISRGGVIEPNLWWYDKSTRNASKRIIDWLSSHGYIPRK